MAWRQLEVLQRYESGLRKMWDIEMLLWVLFEQMHVERLTHRYHMTKCLQIFVLDLSNRALSSQMKSQTYPQRSLISKTSDILDQRPPCQCGEDFSRHSSTAEGRVCIEVSHVSEIPSSRFSWLRHCLLYRFTVKDTLWIQKHSHGQKITWREVWVHLVI